MKILITGAFGSVGSHLIPLLLQDGHNVRCFGLKNKKSLKVVRKVKNDTEIFFGDIRNLDDVEKAVVGQELVIHLAAIVPPRFTHEPVDYSQKVNVNGLKNVIKAIEGLGEKGPKLIFPSSVAVYGDVRKRGACILNEEDAPQPNADDLYAQQKVLGEENIKKSSITWSIFRFGFIPNVANLKFDPMMFDVPLNTNMEIIHVKDAALALAHAINKEEIWNKILLIAGGDSCRLTYKEFVGKMLEAMGIGALPDEAFGNRDFHCGYMDTTQSQELLKYQNYSVDDLIDEMRQNAGALRFFAILFRPIARAFLLKQSPYYKKSKK
ncbi:MAG: NAD-dependent epimerase/dehydratase family protein [Candidatus Heimdallarchaeota archaeon]